MKVRILCHHFGRHLPQQRLELSVPGASPAWRNWRQDIKKPIKSWLADLLYQSGERGLIGFR